MKYILEGLTEGGRHIILLSSYNPQTSVESKRKNSILDNLSALK